MNDYAWFVSRATGIVAIGLGAASLVLGVLFSARQTGTRRRPNWWLDLHNWSGGLTLAFTGAHMIALLAASDLGIGVRQLLVPGAPSAFDSVGMLTGVLAFYAYAVVVFSSWPRRRFPRKAWHLVHLLAVPAVVLGGVHGFLVGTDGRSPLFEALLALLAGLCVYPLVMRVAGMVTARRDRAARRPTAPATPTPPRRPAVAFVPAPPPYPPLPVPSPPSPPHRVAAQTTGGR